MSTKKFYAVIRGRGPVPAIYDVWGQCEQKISGYPNALYKSFSTFEEAQRFIEEYGHQKGNKSNAINEVHLYVDGSFKPGIHAYGYGFVVVHEQKVVQEASGWGNKPDAVQLRNVSGEMLATTEGLKCVLDLGYSSVAVHHDYQGIAAWAEGSWKRKNKFTRAYHKFILEMKKLLDIRFVKVTAHSGDVWNDRADELAKKGIEDYQKKEV